MKPESNPSMFGEPQNKPQYLNCEVQKGDWKTLGDATGIDLVRDTNTKIRLVNKVNELLQM